MRRTDKLATFMCRLFGSLVVSTSWNHKGLSRSVCEIFTFYRVMKFYVIINLVEDETFVDIVMDLSKANKHGWLPAKSAHELQFCLWDIC